MRKITLIVIILFYSFFSNAQPLSGTYTIGGVNPDYVTISAARNDLFNWGISGNVIFNIRDGIYNEGLALGGMTLGNPNDSVTFQSESADSSKVKIIAGGNSTTGAYNTIGLTYSNFNFILKNLTIENTASPGITIECDYVTKLVSIINCSIKQSSFENSIEQGYSYGIKLINSYCSGAIDIAYGFGPAIFSSNIFSINSPIYITYTESAVIVNNLFYKDTVSANLSLELSRGDSAQVINNQFWGNVNLGSSLYSLIVGNKFYGGLENGFGNHCNFYDNFIYYSPFFPTIYFSGANNNIFSNNFAPNINFNFIQSAFNIFENNNFPRNINGNNNTFINNNYQGATIPWDTNPYHITPNYADTLTDLHATNMQLSGRGVYLPSVLIDIDSLIRPNPPTIGANEICISKDTFNLPCGDYLRLVLCHFHNNPHIVWSPVTGLNNANTSNPIASPAVSTTYYGRDSITGVIDSIRINVVSFQVQAFPNALINCGDSIVVNATLNAGVTYHWSPASGLSNPNIIAPIAKPSQTTTYTVTAINPRCGNSTDTLRITVNPLPRAQYYFNSTDGLTISLVNTSTCADSYLWNFGDGDTSNIVNPTHTYLISGTYTVILIACNSYGCDTIRYQVNVVDNSGIKELSKLSGITISPNPFTSQTTISFSSEQKNTTIKIMDVVGKEIKTVNFTGKQYIIEKGTMQSGVYFVQITDGHKNMVNRKVVVE